MANLSIVPLMDTPATLAALSEILIEVVANGGSVNFMHPMSVQEAEGFWRNWLAAASLGTRIVLGAHLDKTLVGTVTLLLAFPPNQPHRAEIGKLMTKLAHQGKGVATALMRHAEKLAIDHQKTLLVLDTATEDGASGFYERLGYHFVGEIPGFALKPHGGLTGARFYWKQPQSID